MNDKLAEAFQAGFQKEAQLQTMLSGAGSAGTNVAQGANVLAGGQYNGMDMSDIAETDTAQTASDVASGTAENLLGMAQTGADVGGDILQNAGQGLNDIASGELADISGEDLAAVGSDTLENLSY